MNTQIIEWQSTSAQQKKDALARPAIADNALLSTQVGNILSQVQKQGDKALFSLTEQFDGIALTTLAVTPEQVAQAKLALTDKRIKAINTAYGQIKRFHNAQISQDVFVETCPGVRCILKTEAIEISKLVF